MPITKEEAKKRVIEFVQAHEKDYTERELKYLYSKFLYILLL